MAIAAMDKLQQESEWQAAQLKILWSQELSGHLGDGDLAFVGNALGALLDAYPYDEDLLLTQAQWFQAEGRWLEASDAYYELAEQSLGEMVDDLIAQARQNATSALTDMQQQSLWPQALDYLDQLLWREPDLPQYLTALVEFNLASGNVDNARLQLERLQALPDQKSQSEQLLQAINQAANPKPTVLQLQSNGKHLRADLVLEENLAVSLMLDTGASLSVITPEILALLQDARYQRTVTMNTAAGPTSAEIYRVSHAQLGPYQMHNVELAVLPLTGVGSQGLLGMNILRNFTFQIDTEAKTLTLEPGS